RPAKYTARIEFAPKKNPRSAGASQTNAITNKRRGLNSTAPVVTAQCTRSFMPISDDVDAETLISHLCGPLPPPDRAAFRAAAENAREQLPCAGEGLVYRIVTGLWRSYFRPPSDCDVIATPRHHVRSKLVAAPPIAYDGDGRHVRYRRSKQVG